MGEWYLEIGERYNEWLEGAEPGRLELKIMRFDILTSRGP
jgi:hypothetical protein